MTDTANPNPDWYPDPTGRFEQRYWNGSQWTEHVTSAGQTRTDPLPDASADPSATADLPGLGASDPAPSPAPVEPSPLMEQPSDPGAASTWEPGPSAGGLPAEPEPVAPAGPAPDWYPDPAGRYEQRYWDGSDWTDHVSSAGQQGVDPLADDGPATGAGGTVATGPQAPGTTPASTAEVNPFAASSPEPTLGPVPGIDPPGLPGQPASDEPESQADEGPGPEAPDTAEPSSAATPGADDAPVPPQSPPGPEPTAVAPPGDTTDPSSGPVPGMEPGSESSSGSVPGMEPGSESSSGPVPGMEPGSESSSGPVPGMETGSESVESSADSVPGVVAPGGSGIGDADTSVAPAAAPGGPAPDWYPDPTGRHEQRYWDGAQWTEHASSGGAQVVDPI